ncbi:unnamed protein product [Ceratitis capitata]|uniref:(Mediterranean fruit fly) hypothetical protein n=1 Tax=Ceratitis capitata TaxID=7213 RepID=A0A811UIJ8_CERCA|nr:unnamed protein product [Ceratitis capitata]
MADEVQKEFVQSFISFLKRPSTSQHMSADCKESVDVSIQCLQAAFDISDETIGEAACLPEANKDKKMKNLICMKYLRVCSLNEARKYLDWPNLLKMRAIV